MSSGVWNFRSANSLANIVTVATAGGDYAHPIDALNSISGNSSTNRFCIDIAPGTYTIDNSGGPIQLKDFVGMVACSLRSVIFQPLDPTQDMFTAANFAYIEGIVFTGNTTGWILNHTAADSNVNINDCVLRDSGNGFFLNNASGIMEIRRLAINNPLATTTAYGIKVESGTGIFKDIGARATSAVTTVLDISGVNTLCTIVDFVTGSPNTTTGIRIYDGATVSGSAINMIFPFDGLIVYGDNTVVRLDSLKILNAQQDGFRIDNVGTGIRFSLFSGVIYDAVRYNFNILNENALVTGSGYSQLEKSNVVPNSKLYTSIIDVTEDDEGVNIFGELHVGTSMRPAESVLGGGDSHTNMFVYSFDGTSTFTDRTAIAKSASGSTFTFDGVTTNNAIYIANRYPLTFEGIKISINTAATIGSGEIIAEFWNGSSWEEFNGCTVKSSSPYFKYAKDYFLQSGNYHIKFDPYIRATWITNDPPGLGTNYYWMRFRIVTAITTSPIIEQIKIHTNRAEINGDGTIEKHMDGRVYKKLPIGAIRPLEGNMQSASIYVDENVGVGLTNNRFTTAPDLLGVSFELPEDCDTSGPLIFLWKGKFASTGNVDFTVRRKIVAPGDSHTNTEPAASGETLTVTTGSIAIAAADVRSDFLVKVDISDAIPSRDGGYGDEIWITLQYPTRGAGNFDYTKISANYLSDFDGKHLRQ